MNIEPWHTVCRAHLHKDSRVMPYSSKILSVALNLIVCYMTYRIPCMGKDWRIECHSPFLTFPFIISCNLTLHSFANILPSNWFGLTRSPIFYPTKSFPRTVVCQLLFLVIEYHTYVQRHQGTDFPWRLCRNITMSINFVLIIILTSVRSSTVNYEIIKNTRMNHS